MGSNLKLQKNTRGPPVILETTGTVVLTLRSKFLIFQIEFLSFHERFFSNSRRKLW